jgi:hypothetical protein
MKKVVKEETPAQSEKISDEMLATLRNAHTNLQTAHATFNFISGQVVQTYGLRQTDTLDLQTGVITRGPKEEQAPQP